jgi:hypothetical protein
MKSLEQIKCKNIFRLNVLGEINNFLKKNFLNQNIITTRIDNDDSVSIDFIETIQRKLLIDKNVLNFDYGYVCSYRNNVPEYYTRTHLQNMFISLKEIVNSDLKTVHYVQHTDMPKTFEAVRILDNSYWMITAHGNNIRNNCEDLTPLPDSTIISQRFTL